MCACYHEPRSAPGWFHVGLCSICHSLFLSFQFPTNESCVFERVHCFLTENQKTSGKHTVWDDNSEGTESQTLFSTATFLIFYRGMLAGVDSQQYSAQSDFPPLISLFSKYPEPLHVTLSSDHILPTHPSPILHLGHLPELGMTYTPLFHSAVSVAMPDQGKILYIFFYVYFPALVAGGTLYVGPVARFRSIF